MRRIAIGLLASLVFGGCAIAAERPHHPPIIAEHEPLPRMENHGVYAERAHHPAPLVIPNEPSQIPDGQHVPLHAACESSLAQLEARAPKGIKFDLLNAGQYHFAVGLFVATPPVTPSLPRSDGAVLISAKGQPIANIVWTADGKICGGFVLSAEMARLVLSISPVPGEKIAPADDPNELTL